MADPEMQEIDVEPDVFYDFLLSIPRVKQSTKTKKRQDQEQIRSTRSVKVNAPLSEDDKKKKLLEIGDKRAELKDKWKKGVSKMIEQQYNATSDHIRVANLMSFLQNVTPLTPVEVSLLTFAALHENNEEVTEVNTDDTFEISINEDFKHHYHQFQEKIKHDREFGQTIIKYDKLTQTIKSIYERGKRGLLHEEDMVKFECKLVDVKVTEPVETFEMTYYYPDKDIPIDEQIGCVAVLDSVIFKFLWAMVSNVVVFFLIYAINYNIPSRGLPGRQQIDGTTFKVILKADRNVDASERFTKADEITDVCQGLGWWMHDDRHFILQEKDKYPWPEGDELKLLTKQHWDKNLNPGYTCPLLQQETKVEGDKRCERGTNPVGKRWSPGETKSFFLFQDQVGAEVYHKWGSVVTLNNIATGQAMEFTVMSGDMNERIQMLQPIGNYLDAKGLLTSWWENPSPGAYRKKEYRDVGQVFWRARDRIFPSAWAVQALFDLPWNGKKGWDENHVVGGYNAFGRRPSAIVKANGVEHFGGRIAEVIWKYLERSCWSVPAKGKTATYDETKDGKARSKYDKTQEGQKFVKWEDLDQDQRAWWRALGLGVDRSTCDVANTKVTTKDTCISKKAPAGCTRVNYHTAKRWENDANNDTLAKQRFDARDFSDIFREYECETKEFNAVGKLEKTELTVPNTSPLTWDSIEAGQYEDGRFMAAASNLGYDEDEWNAHALAPDRPEGPPDNLVLVVENYLEGEPSGSTWASLFFFTQIICIVIMIAVSVLEIRHLIPWWYMTMTNERPGASGCVNKMFEMLRPRLASGIVAVFQYLTIPVLTIEVSVQLILESENVLECIKDTIALLFLLDINNYLQIRNQPDSSKFKIKMQSSRIDEMFRVKQVTVKIVFVTLVVFFLVFVVQNCLGNSGGTHHSLLFNPFITTGGDYEAALLTICIMQVAVLVIALPVAWVLGMISSHESKAMEKSGFNYKPPWDDCGCLQRMMLQKSPTCHNALHGVWIFFLEYVVKMFCVAYPEQDPEQLAEEAGDVRQGNDSNQASCHHGVTFQAVFPLNNFERGTVSSPPTQPVGFGGGGGFADGQSSKGGFGGVFGGGQSSNGGFSGGGW